MSSHTLNIDTSNYIIESPVKGTPLTLADKDRPRTVRAGRVHGHLALGWDDLQQRR